MMTSKQIQIVKRNLLAAQISYRRSELNEESLYVELHNFFQRLKTQVLKEFEEYWNDDFMLQAQADLILAPVHEAQKEYSEILQKHIEKEFYTGKATAKRYVALAQKKAKRESRIKAANKAQTKVPISGILKRERELFGTSEHAGQKLANQSFTASEKTMARIDNSINQILTDGYKEGWGQNKVAADLEKRFEQLKTWEARRIARTEIHNAHNEGINQTYVDMNVSYTQWGATQDDRTRGLKPSDTADHVALDGEIIPFGGTYSNGLAYPGDTSGPIEEWINCRCVNLPFIIPDGYIAPPFSPFREDDLVPTLDVWNQDELIEQATQDLEEALPTNVSPQLPTIKREYIDTSTLDFSENSNTYYVKLSDGVEVINGKHYLKGLEVHDVSPFGVGKISKVEMDTHNKLFEPKPLDINKLEPGMIPGEYKLPGDIEGIEIVGSEVNSKGKVVPIASEGAILQYNKQFESSETTHGGLIDINKLSEDAPGEYLLSADEDGVAFNESTGKWEYKGLEVKDYDPDYDIGTLTAEEINKHNEKFKSTENKAFDEMINTSELIISTSNTYLVNSKQQGFEIVFGSAYYKGLKLKEYDSATGEGYLLLGDIEAHNKKLVADEMGELPPKEQLENILSFEELNEFNDLLDEINQSVEAQSSDYMSMSGKVTALEQLEEKISEVKEISEFVKEESKAQEKFKPELIDMGELVYDNYLDEYKIPKSEFKLNPNTHKHEYKGLAIDFDTYINSSVMIYLKPEQIIEHNKQVTKSPTKGKLTLEEIESLEIDPYGDYMIDEEHRVTYNEETGAWEYKGVELFEYDEADHYGIIDQGTMEDYIKSNNLQRDEILDNKYVNSMESLTPIKSGGEIYIVDTNTGKKYIYDKTSAYERKQDVEQRKVNFTQHETDSTAHWGRYGHQLINGLLYKVVRYDEYGNLKQDYSYFEKQIDKLIPHYNKLQDLAVDLNKGDISLVEYSSEKNKIMGEMEKIIETVEDPNNESLLADYDDDTGGWTCDTIKNVMWEIMDMDSSIEKAPNLLQDTFFVRFGHFEKEWCEKGKIIEYDGYTSTTYESGAASHFEQKMAENPNRWAILIMAEEDSNGVRLNNQFHALTTEREWMLARRQNIEVVDFDEANRTALIKVIK